jgi:hypothetical protein
MKTIFQDLSPGDRAFELYPSFQIFVPPLQFLLNVFAHIVSGENVL